MSELILNISGGKISNMQAFKNLFRNLKEGKHLLTVKDMRKRSLPQNAYYWSVVVPLVRKGLNEVGYDEVQNNDDAHEVIKHLHLKKRIISKQTGEVIDIAGNTSKLTKPMFNDFIEDVCRWSAEFLGVVIPSPTQEFAVFDEYVSETINAI